MGETRSRWQRGGVAVLLAVLTAGCGGVALAAPSAELWERWTAHDPASRETVDHAAWTAFLERYVSPGPDGIARVDYAGVSAADRQALDAYIGRLSATRVSGLGRDEQRAYWINLYNALTVQVVLDHYPVASIRDIRISPGLFSIGPWGKELVRVEGEPLSLDDIEHRILRPIWGDPRIHYAVNCASLGCPNLRRRAFTAADADAMLDAGARDYVNDERGVSVRGDRLVVSNLYVWFRDDFGGSDRAVIAHLRRYARPELAAALARFDEIDGDRYDWRLNDRATAGAGD
jgi:Protein of unknown function, DUF547